MFTDRLINNELEKRINHSLEKALCFFEKKQVPLKRVLKKEYVDYDYYENPLVFALSNTRKEFSKEYHKYVAQNVARREWKNNYGLRISGDALLQLCEANKELFNHYPGQDVVFFKPCKYLNGEDLEKVTIHELWHLVEEEHGVDNNTSLIIEATATYAMFYYSGTKNETRMSECSDCEEMLYSGGASIVQEFVKNEKNPLFELVNNNSLRQRISNEMNKRIKPWIKKKINNKILPATKIINSFPELRDITPEKLISFYKNIGASKLAEELEGQDLSLIIDYNFDTHPDF